MRQQRQLPALRAHIDQLLASGWAIASRDPLKLSFQKRHYVVRCGMLISET